MQGCAENPTGWCRQGCSGRSRASQGCLQRVLPSQHPAERAFAPQPCGPAGSARRVSFSRRQLRIGFVPERSRATARSTISQKAAAVASDLCITHDGKLQVRKATFLTPTSRADDQISRFEYVKQFEQPDSLLPNTWIVVRIDGRGFTKYASITSYERSPTLVSDTAPDSPPSMASKNPTTNGHWSS